MYFINLFFKLYWYLMKLLVNLYYFGKFGLLKIQNLNKKFKIFLPKNQEMFEVFVIENSTIHQKMISLKNDPDYIEKECIVFRKYMENKLLMIFLTNLKNIEKINQGTKPCSYEFLSIIINLPEKDINITHLLNNFNNYYYIENSILFDKRFMKWMSLYHLKEKLNNYSISIIDHKVNEFKIDEKQYLLLNKCNYEIINCNK